MYFQIAMRLATLYAQVLDEAPEFVPLPPDTGIRPMADEMPHEVDSIQSAINARGHCLSKGLHFIKCIR